MVSHHKYKYKMVSKLSDFDNGNSYTWVDNLFFIEIMPRQFERWYLYCRHNAPATWKGLSQNVPSCWVGFLHDISGPIHNSIEITIPPASSHGDFLTSVGFKQNWNGSSSSENLKFGHHYACRWPSTVTHGSISRHSEDYEVYAGWLHWLWS